VHLTNISDKVQEYYAVSQIVFDSFMSYLILSFNEHRADSYIYNKMTTLDSDYHKLANPYLLKDN